MRLVALCACSAFAVRRLMSLNQRLLNDTYREEFMDPKSMTMESTRKGTQTKIGNQDSYGEVNADGILKREVD